MSQQLVMVGVSHRRAPLALLERTSMARHERRVVLEAVRRTGCTEAVILSTCSRTEVYARGVGDVALLQVLAEHGDVAPAVLEPAAEVRTGAAVVHHLFRVTAGLESRLVGEIDVLGQVRSAFREAHAAGMTGALLGQLLPAALRCGARVHAETALGATGPSLGRRAVDVGLEMTGSSDDLAIMVVGSGRMAGRATEHLRQLGRRPVVAARDQVRAAALAGSGLVRPLPELAHGLAGADLVICATSAAHHVVTLQHVTRAMTRRTRPMTVVDLSVPRNVDAAVAHVPGVRLVDVAAMHLDPGTDSVLHAAVEAAGDLVSAAARQYVDRMNARRAGPVIAAMRRRVEATCLQELVAVAPPATDLDELTRAARAAAGKKLHGATMAARAAAAAGDGDGLRALCAQFGIPAVTVDGPGPSDAAAFADLADHEQWRAAALAGAGDLAS